MARDKFREAPVPGIPHISHGDVESCFAALITLYHIRKLLSSHGIRPAYEMLEEKLQEGYAFTFNKHNLSAAICYVNQNFNEYNKNSHRGPSLIWDDG